MSVLLETQELTKMYGTQRANDAISIKLHQGDIYGLIGRNGAGKTTFMRLISGLAFPTSGSYNLFGKEGKDNLISTRVSCLIENTGIYPTFTAYDHLLLKAQAMGMTDRKKLSDILELVGLSDVRRKKVKQFSLGMKQRLGIALALIGDPDLIILDEPINGLDPQGIVEVRRLIERLNKEEGITFLISSHILDELAKLANRFGIIDRGLLLEEITREELEQKSRDRLELTTSKVTEASLLLEQLNFKDFTLLDDNTFHIYSGLDRLSELVLTLAKEDIPMEHFSVHKGSLEDYYLELTR